MINMSKKVIKYNEEVKKYEVFEDWREIESEFDDYQEAWECLNPWGVNVYTGFIPEEFEEDIPLSHTCSAEYPVKGEVLSVWDIETGEEVDSIDENKQYLFECLNTFFYNESDERESEYYFVIN